LLLVELVLHVFCDGQNHPLAFWHTAARELGYQRLFDGCPSELTGDTWDGGEIRLAELLWKALIAPLSKEGEGV
jgi:hypothetical protein